MKRTPLRPSAKGPERGTTPLARAPMARNQKPLRQTKHRKCYAHLRDPKYRAWVRTFPCVLSYRDGHTCAGRVEFSHVENEGNGGPDVGNGLPLCSHAGHRFGAKSWHVMGKKSWQAHWGVDAGEAARSLGDIWRLARGLAARRYDEAGQPEGL